MDSEDDFFSSPQESDLPPLAGEEPSETSQGVSMLSSGRGSFGFVGIFGLLAVIYLLTFSWVSSYDSLCYYRAVESGDPAELVHPHHILYLPALNAWYSLWAILGYGGASVLPLKTFSLVGACGAVVAFAFVLGLVLGAGLESYAMLLAFGFTFLHWHFATMVEPVSFFLLFSILNLYLMLRLVSDVRIMGRHVGALGVVNGLAVLFHQALILACPLSLVLLWVSARSGTRTRYVLGYLGIVVALIVVPYVLVGRYLAGAESGGDFYRWLTSFFGHFGPRGLGQLGNIRVGLMLVGVGRMLLGGTALKPYLVGDVPRDARFFLAVVPFISTLLLFALGGLALMLRIRRVVETRARQLLLIVLVGLVFGGAAAWWEPANRTFWAPTLPCMFLLAGLGYANLPRGKGWDLAKGVLLLLFAVLLFLGNLSGGVWAKHVARDNEEPFLVELRKIARPSDLVILEDGRLGRCLEYFSPQIRAIPVWLPGGAESAASDTTLERAVAEGHEVLRSGNRVFISSEAVGGMEDVLRVFRSFEGAEIEVADLFHYEHEYLGNEKRHTVFEVKLREPEGGRDGTVQPPDSVRRNEP